MAAPKIIIHLMLIGSIAIVSCTKKPDINTATMLDGGQMFDPSLYNPDKYLVSHAIDTPSAEQKNTPVVIAVHGYSATTFEWDEFRSYCDSRACVLVSQVLLGGHGTSYEDFKQSTWKDWQEPILAEYTALRAKGYTNINFVGSSTACPLMLDLITRGEISSNSMRHIFMVDPIIIPSDKMLSMIGLVGPMLGYIEASNTPAEEGHWYHYRPQETLQQLSDLIDKTRKDLQNGIVLPEGTLVKVYKSIKDPVADAVSAVLIYKGLSNSDGSYIDVEMLQSELHVVTRLNGRETITPHDLEVQAHVFGDMYKILLQ